MNTDDEDTPPEAIDGSTDPAGADDVLTEDVLTDDGFDRADFDEPAVGAGPADVGLVRDPTATFGGVLSGVAHRYGWDVAVTRLAAVVLVLATSGVGLIVYLVAWVIVPRAKVWPPAGAARRTRLSGRDMGIGLVAAGALLALAIAGGDFGVVLIPLALIGGGLWLLLQKPSIEADDPTIAESAAAQFHYPGPAPAPPSAPVQPRSRRRRVAVFAIVGSAVLGLFAIVAIPIAFLFAFSSADIEFRSAERIEFRPVSVGDIPSTVIEDSGSILLDLSALEAADFEAVDTPIRVRLDLDLGSIEVVLPADLMASIDAEVRVGSVWVFGSESGGFGSSQTIVEADPHLELVLDVDLGDIDVVRKTSPASSG